MYFSIQFEYNVAKKHASLDYDTLYTKFDERIYQRYLFLVGIIYIIIYLSITFYGFAINSLDSIFVKSLTSISTGFAFIAAVLLLLNFILNSFLLRRSIFKNWEELMVKKTTKQNDKNGANDAESKADNDRKKHKA